MREIINILEDRYSPAEIIDMLNEIEKEDIDEYAISHDICPKCNQELIRHEYLEDRGEFWGYPCKEKMVSTVCSGCGNIFD